jgi:prophage tail gpP-like protein
MANLAVVIDNREIVVESASFIRTMDTGCDALSVVMPWQPGLDAKIDKITKKYSYSPAKIYIDDILVSEMVLYDVTQRTNSQGTVKELDFFSKTADIIDSTVIAPYEMNNVKLTDRCKQQCNPYGINVFVGEDAAARLLETRRIITTTRKVTTPEIGKGKVLGLDYVNKLSGFQNVQKSKLVTDEKKFPRVKAEPTETGWSHISKLAAQRGLLLSCTKNGDLLLTTANINGKPVGTIEESISPLTEEYSAKFSGRDRFNTYRAIVKSSSTTRPAGQQKDTDKTVIAPRLLTFNADDNIPGEAKNAATWRKNKSAADSMSTSFPVNSWYAPDGTLWKPNTNVIVKSKTLGTEKGFTYLITRVDMKYSSGGNSSVLELKPPSMYGNGEIKE